MDRFIEEMGLMAQEDGLPPIAGRIGGYFIIYGGPVSFAQLAKELRVSRGSISTNARILAEVGLIERVSMTGSRQDYYQLAAAPFSRLIEGYLGRMRRMQEIVGQARESAPSSMPGTRRRLQEMYRFYHEAVESNEALLQRLTQPTVGEIG